MKNESNGFKSKLGNIAGGVFRQVSVILLALVIATLVIILSGYNPQSVYLGLLKGITSDIGGTLRWATPLVLSGLAISIAFRTSVWNLGVDGQLYLGAMAATVIGLLLPDVPYPFSLILAIIGGLIAGALWGGLAGLLRVLWGADELVTTIFLNYIAFLFTDLLILGPLKGTGIAAGTFSTNRIPEQYWLARFTTGSQINYGLVIAIIMTIIVAILMFRTKTGYEFKIVGRNPSLARYAGIKVKKTIFKCMAISGAIGGLVGVVEILGIHRRFPGRFSSGLGFDGIVVSLLANNNPIGILFSGWFFGALKVGSMNMERITEVPRAMVDIVESIIILLVSAQFVFKLWKQNKKVKMQEESMSTERKNKENLEGV